MVKGKVETYIGFCIKARKIALGSGSIDVVKKGVYLVMVCSSASDNTLKLAIKYKNRFSCPLVICKTLLEDVVHKPNCKVAAIRDESLAHAILENLGDEYELYADGGGI